MRINPNTKKMSPVATATASTWLSCDSASTKTTLTRSGLDSGTRRGRSGIASNGVPASPSASAASLASGCMIGRARLNVLDTRNAAAMANRNSSAIHSRVRLTVGPSSTRGVEEHQHRQQHHRQRPHEQRPERGEMRRCHPQRPTQDGTETRCGAEQDERDDDGLQEHVHELAGTGSAEESGHGRDQDRDHRDDGPILDRRDAGHRPAHQGGGRQHKHEDAQHEPLRAGRGAVDIDGVFARQRDDDRRAHHHHRERGQRGSRPRHDPPHQGAGPQHGGQSVEQEPPLGGGTLVRVRNTHAFSP